jgi:hypothetical protein
MEQKKLKALEELVKKNFCFLEVAKSIVGCSYINESFCPKVCKFYKQTYPDSNMKGDSYEKCPDSK